MTTLIERVTRWATASAVASLLLVGCGGGDSNDQPQGQLQIQTLSNRADLISDGDALVEVVLPANATPDGLAVAVNGTDVSSGFAKRTDGRVTGLVTGLTRGVNTVTASKAGTGGARLTITNTPRSGPVFSGPQSVPYYCATPVPQASNGLVPATNASGLTGQPDANCTIPTEYKYYYKTTAAGCAFAVPDPSPTVPFTSVAPPTAGTPPSNPCFKSYDPSAAAPPDLASTTTQTGTTVPYIVRVERGVINRGIYDIAVLFNPAKPWTAVSPQAQWNGKVYYQFGGGTANPRRQSRTTSSWTVDMALSQGFAVAQNSLSDSGLNSNKVLLAETVMMMKEHIIDSYGPITYVHGNGCSGGAINSHLTMSVTPNLIDGFSVACTFPDLETALLEVQDCILLVEAYQKPQFLNAMATGNAGGAYTQSQINTMKAAVNGHRDQSGCQAWMNLVANAAGNTKALNYFPRRVVDQNTGAVAQDATATNGCQLPLAAIYDAVLNPGGVRCSYWDWASSVWGLSSDKVHPLEPWDNTGVQYGFKALLNDQISGEVFVTLNEIIGGFDKDTNYTTARSVGDAAALATAYRGGIITTGASMAKHAEIDQRGFDDSLINLPPGGGTFVGVHQNWRSFSVRDRRDRDAGNHAGYVMWRYGRNFFAPTAPVMVSEAFSTMDSWLMAIKADTSQTSIEQKVIAAKPANAFDYCLLSTDATQSVKVTDQAVCDSDPFLKATSSPRQVAGGPRTEDIMKCQLRALSLGDYGGRISGSQLARLQAVFPTGVCDWTKSGVGQQAQAPAPLTFSSGPGGVQLPPAPTSTPL